jgi:hypothetical protein
MKNKNISLVKLLNENTQDRDERWNQIRDFVMDEKGYTDEDMEYDEIEDEVNRETDKLWYKEKEDGLDENEKIKEENKNTTEDLNSQTANNLKGALEDFIYEFTAHRGYSKDEVLGFIQDFIDIIAGGPRGLGEATYAGKDAKDDIKKDPKYNTLSQDAKKKVDMDLDKGGTATIGEDKIDEESFPGRASSGKLKNIDKALQVIYPYMSKGDQVLKDKTFFAYYRFYNDGDFLSLPFPFLKKLGMPDEQINRMKSIKSANNDDLRNFQKRNKPGDNSYYRYQRLNQKEYAPFLEKGLELIMKYFINRYKDVYKEHKQEVMDALRGKLDESLFKKFKKNAGLL